MRFLVLGAGLQGSAAAFDLLQNPAVKEVRLADLKVDPLRPFLDRFKSDARFKPMALDVKDAAAVKRAMSGVDAALSAVPYFFNGPLAAQAVEVGIHWCDLGGNTAIVKEQQKLAPQAKSKGLTIIPDCGLAPGLVNILAESAIRRLDLCDSCRLFVGGLPQDPKPPLNYHLVYSLEGVLDYYTTPSFVLQDGQPSTRVALSEREEIDLAGVGKLEAFHTAGGLSTMFEKYRGKIRRMEYKTLRYPGHAAIMEAIRELGFFDTTPLDVKGQKVAPRDLTIATLYPKLNQPKACDLVALRVVAEGTKNGKPAKVGYELVDRMDETNGISAMMRTTGYSLSVTAQMQVSKTIGPPGVWTPDECVPADAYLGALAKRGIAVRELV